ncbi:hypothetical protein DVJ77_04000 [Dyella tabacisoli]|uniref:Thioredoxin domain-containing protein n=2 Tax=Dyella tabacisoli TaxID=2282381 RepID=A0A369UR78_9GAMM|nr:hypothetical protein DVJ77_04000 [Dyella tabacisoli]
MALAACLFLALESNNTSAKDSLSPIEQYFGQLNDASYDDIGLSYREKAGSIRRIYDESISADQHAEKLASISDHDLKLLYESAHLAAFYTHDQKYLADMQLDLAELVRRGLDSDNNYVDLYATLVSQRKFDDARLLGKQHPAQTFKPLPSYQDLTESTENGPSVLTLSEGQHGLEMNRTTVDLTSPTTQIVVISHPLCGPSSRAMHDIQSDPALSKAFISHARWITPQDGNANFDVLARWNNQNPAFPMSPAYRQDDWPMIDIWATPTFYFLQNGKVVKTVSGWSGQDSRHELEQGLRQIGLLPLKP